MRIATFNVQNLRLRTRDGRNMLDGAWDRDTPEPDPSSALAHADRMKTAKVICDSGADVVALQEVYDRDTLDFFHDRFLVPAGAEPYDQRHCIKGNDGRGLNVAVLSRRPVKKIESHADKTGGDLGLANLPREFRDFPIFRRDCLEVHLDTVVLFICHFKAPYPDVDRAFTVRRAEAAAVRRIIETCFTVPETERWIVLGDFNEPAYGESARGSAMNALCDGFAVDLLDRLPQGRDWTFEVPDSHLHSRPDRILVSPRLAREFPAVQPQIIRSAMDISRSDEGPLPTGWHPRASDHALVYVDLPGL